MDIPKGLQIFILILIILFICLIPLIVVTLAIYVKDKKELYKYVIIILLYLLLLAIYIMIGGVFYKYVVKPFYSFIPRKQMNVWDNIGYTLIFIFQLFVVALIVKSVRDRRFKWEYLRACFGLLLLIIIFYIIYGIYLFNDKLPIVTLALTIIVIGLTALLLILEYTILANSVFLIPLYMIYGAACIAFVVCLFWLIIQSIEKLYNNLNKK